MNTKHEGMTMNENWKRLEGKTIKAAIEVDEATLRLEFTDGTQETIEAGGTESPFLDLAE